MLKAVMQLFAPRKPLQRGDLVRNSAAVWPRCGRGSVGLGVTKEESTQRPDAGPRAVCSECCFPGRAQTRTGSSAHCVWQARSRTEVFPEQLTRGAHVTSTRSEGHGPVLSSHRTPGPSAQGAAHHASFTGAQKPQGLGQAPTGPSRGDNGPQHHAACWACVQVASESSFGNYFVQN